MTRDIVVTVAGIEDKMPRHFILHSEKELSDFLLHLDYEQWFVATIDYVDGTLETEVKEVFVKEPALELGNSERLKRA